jgi:hypothetical protein
MQYNAQARPFVHLDGDEYVHLLCQGHQLQVLRHRLDDRLSDEDVELALDCFLRHGEMQIVRHKHENKITL